MTENFVCFFAKNSLDSFNFFKSLKNSAKITLLFPMLSGLNGSFLNKRSILNRMYSIAVKACNGSYLKVERYSSFIPRCAKSARSSTLPMLASMLRWIGWLHMPSGARLNCKGTSTLILYFSLKFLINFPSLQAVRAERITLQKLWSSKSADAMPNCRVFRGADGVEEELWRRRRFIKAVIRKFFAGNNEVVIAFCNGYVFGVHGVWIELVVLYFTVASSNLPSSK